jgi:hypothetical protein
VESKQNKEFRAPLVEIFRLPVLGNTLTACLWMASGFVIYYSVHGMFATHLQKDLHLDAASTAMPIALANLVAFLASGCWGFVADVFGRRWAMIIPATIGLFITPLYLFVDSYPLLAGAFIAQGAFLGAIYGQNPSYLSERFPTEVRAPKVEPFQTTTGTAHLEVGWVAIVSRCDVVGDVRDLSAEGVVEGISRPHQRCLRHWARSGQSKRDRTRPARPLTVLDTLLCRSRNQGWHQHLTHHEPRLGTDRTRDSQLDRERGRRP